MLYQLTLSFLCACLPYTSQASLYPPFDNQETERAPPAFESSYSYNPYVPLHFWSQVEPYFLPANHPVKAKLDRIFKSKRVLLNADAFQQAFGKIKQRGIHNIVVGRHPSLKGYLIKAYLDTQPVLADWHNWIQRIQGAEHIRDCIQRHGYKQFKVPRKWIYPLPLEPSPPDEPGYTRKNFILVVEDMRLLTQADNKRAYKELDSYETLEGLYTILKEEGLIDSIFIDNVPFTRRGYLAFIDTEHYHQWPVNYSRLTPAFSSSMQIYWKELIKKKNN